MYSFVRSLAGDRFSRRPTWNSRSTHRRVVLSLAVLVLALGAAGRAAAAPTAAFADRSYAPGDEARLAVTDSGGPVDVQVFRTGPEADRTLSDSSLGGVAVDDPTRLAADGGEIPIRWCPSGLYFARVSAPDRIAFAPFVLLATPENHVRVAVVEPTNTWEAYNFRDDATWYAGCTCSVGLDRPFLDRGVPPHFHQYDEGFLRWMAHTGKQADYLSDDDLERFPLGDALAHQYDLIVFPGHEECVTTHVYDIVERYRDLGGNLMFLAADNFFYRVDRSGEEISRTGRWRDLGRPEAALIGAQYAGWDERTYGNAPYRVVDTAAAPWLFAGTGLHDGSTFGNFGIEIDERTAGSPSDTHVLCEIANAFGPGQTAQMTYYETPNGAKVFAAGVMNFGGWAEWEPVRTMLENLWARLSQP